MTDFSYEVRMRLIEKRRNRHGVITSCRVVWTVGGRIWRESFRTAALAEAFRSEVQVAARRGEAFLISTGRPASWARPAHAISWFEFTLGYVDSKWGRISPNSRRGIAEALVDVTDAMLARDGGPRQEDRRAALRWAYSERIRDGGNPPSDLEPTLLWLRTNTIAMAAFSDRTTAAKLARAALTRISQTKDGSPAAGNTANRKRMVLNNAMEYACETGILTQNPLTFVKWTKPRRLLSVDPRIVINADQARRFLTAVEAHSERGARLKAFFGVLYYAGLRPEEATELRRANVAHLPTAVGEWGELQLTHSQPRSGSRWTDSGRPRQRAPLKHRASGDVRRVPVHPELVGLLRSHLDCYVTKGPDSRVFTSRSGGPVTDRMYLKVFHEARTAAFTPAEAASPLMDVPYSLRHAAVSTWLRTTGDPVQVAQWAGHSVAVLLRVYAKCVHGTQTETLRRIFEATKS